MGKNKVIIRMIFLFVSVLIISLIISLISAAISSVPYYYNIELDYNNKMDNKLSIKSVNLKFYYEDPLNFNSKNSNYLEIIDNKDNILYKENFSIPNIVIYDIGENANFTESKIIELENVSFNVYLPYYENAYQLIIYDNIEKKVLDRIFLSQFSKAGFNRENFKDISSKNKEVGDKTEGIEDREKKELKLLGKELDYKNYIITLLIILIILIIILIYSLKKKERL